MNLRDTDTQCLRGKTALVTGASQRIGAAIACALHAAGANIALHYRSSHDAAHRLASKLEDNRADSVALIQADLLGADAPATVVEHAYARWRQLDILVNNASAFYPTPVGNIAEQEWDEIVGSNLKSPLFLSQAAAAHLREVEGCIVNLADIHGQSPLREHSVYCAAKAGLIMLTKSLALELAPAIRVNAVAPGAILPPPGASELPTGVLDTIPLQRAGEPGDIAAVVLFLVQPKHYITGQILNVDGGKSLTP